ncbi:flagellar biosynthesis repressor FlbT [Roseomonas harenae]|uniref:flagellar biosynthesis repressor FlbT n=1 Tax=Muricoccus harenae TaxID=2692566 RepID=UPI0013318AC8|nr:flagellar biosynthesis repressor FlbT [Roseomonas harenae]
MSGVSPSAAPGPVPASVSTRGPAYAAASTPPKRRAPSSRVGSKWPAAIAEFQSATTSALVTAMLDRALTAAEEDDCYTALKLARRVMRHEEVVLGIAPPPNTRPMPEEMTA